MSDSSYKEIGFFSIQVNFMFHQRSPIAQAACFHPHTDGVELGRRMRFGRGVEYIIDTPPRFSAERERERGGAVHPHVFLLGRVVLSLIPPRKCPLAVLVRQMADLQEENNKDESKKEHCVENHPICFARNVNELDHRE